MLMPNEEDEEDDNLAGDTACSGSVLTELAELGQTGEGDGCQLHTCCLSDMKV